MGEQALYMKRCIQLASLGSGFVSPNPMVGAVLVHERRIIGEGYHQYYGEGHAEVQCLNSVLPEDQSLIQHSTLYVSLEPCAHFGKTPPCAELIIRHRIPKVVVGCRDPFPDVNGKGLERMREAGIEVITGVEEEACKSLNRAFFLKHTQNRPFILLKWAQSGDALIALPNFQPVPISHPQTNRLTHRWRSESDAILVGTRTVASDNPSLTNRNWYGRNPLRMLVDLNAVLSPDLSVFSDGHRTVLFGLAPSKSNVSENLEVVPVSQKEQVIPALIQYCQDHRLQSVMIEGGRQLLQSFVDAGCWDEARIIGSTGVYLKHGIPAPELTNATLFKTYELATDRIMYFRPCKPEFI